MTLILSLSVVHTSYAQWGKNKNKGKDKTEKNLVEAEKFFIEGMKFFILDEHDKAIPYFEKALKKDPDNDEIAYQIARTYFKMESFDYAIPFLLQAIEKNKVNSYYYRLLASLYYEMNRYADASETYEELINLAEDALEADYVEWANSYIAQRKIKEAIKIYDKMESQYGLNESVVRQKQMLYIEINNLDAAIKEGEKLLVAFPTVAEYMLSQAEMLMERNKNDKAKKIIEDFLSQNPENTEPYLMLSEIYRREGNREAQTNALEKVLKDPKVQLDAKISVLLTYYQEAEANNYSRNIGTMLARQVVDSHPEEAAAQAIYGDFLMIEGKNKVAKHHYLKAVDYNPDNFGIWERILQITIEERNGDSAIFYSEEALSIFPNQASIWFYNGIGYMLLEEYDEALSSLLQGKRLVVNNDMMISQFEAQIGDVQYRKGNYTKAYAAYEEAINTYPDNAHALNNYSYHLAMRNEKLNLAEEMSARLVRLHPDNATYLDTHGWVLFMRKKYKEAEKYLARAVSNTQNPAIFEHYGDVLFKLNDTERALEYWRKALDLNPTPELEQKVAEGKL
ncbi:MAG: tetratricopeptide repeat protein [Bernardetiaceae bacterium]|nr:tetratricopeptide repeat protein [Bernardetiaceae bacterium]